MAQIFQPFCLKLVGFSLFLVGHVCCDNCSKLEQVKKKKSTRRKKVEMFFFLFSSKIPYSLPQKFPCTLTSSTEVRGGWHSAVPPDADRRTSFSGIEP